MKVGRHRKLTDAQIADIRAWHAARSALATPQEMRKRHLLSSTLLSSICRGLAYKVPARG